MIVFTSNWQILSQKMNNSTGCALRWQKNSKTNRWLTEQLQVTEGTVSRWSANSNQPPLETLYTISLLFKIDSYDLIESATSKK